MNNQNHNFILSINHLIFKYIIYSDDDLIIIFINQIIITNNFLYFIIDFQLSLLRKFHFQLK
jgi:hypothetical protein